MTAPPWTNKILSLHSTAARLRMLRARYSGTDSVGDRCDCGVTVPSLRPAARAHCHSGSLRMCAARRTRTKADVIFAGTRLRAPLSKTHCLL